MFRYRLVDHDCAPALARQVFAISPAKGAETIVFASSPEVAKTTGQYYYRPTTPSTAGRDDRSASLVWQRSAVLAAIKENGLLPLDPKDHRVLIFSRTPISPVSSSVKWMPACSRAFCILRIVEKFPFTIPSFCSIRRRVARPMPALRESLSWLQPKSARAARI